MKKLLVTITMLGMAASVNGIEPLSRTSTARPHAVDAGTQFNVEHATALINEVVVHPKFGFITLYQK